MSANRATSPCNKFQENIFNKSKCQNCFKPRELHLLSDKNMEQVRPVYGGWLCLAPEGTDFENPVQRSRKWQRRFFILYEDGCLSFALDEQPSTLPQGTMNLTVSSDVSDAETRTGQRNALCISTSQQEVYIRGDSKEIINGWSDQFSSFLQTSKQNQKKKRKVEPVTSQEPSPAKMAATDQSFSSSESLGESRSDDASQSVSPLCRDEERLFDSVCSPDLLSRNMEADRNNIRANNHHDNRDQNQKQDRNQDLNMDHDQDRRRGDSSETMLGVDEQEDKSAVSRKRGRESRSNTREKLPSCGDLTQLCVSPPQRRTRSLDGRTTDTVTTLDLLNFKKGWMVKLDDNEQWKKFWFVLSTNTLRFYRDSVAEECSDLEGEIELTHCYKVAECDVQRSYGFQIQTLQGVFTLSAMTAGSRRSWIQALMRNVHPANAPDVTSLPGLRVSPELLHRPDLTLDSPSSERDAQIKHVSVAQRRKDGRNRTLYWTGFKSQTEPGQDPQRNGAVGSEGRRRKEERRRRYEGMLDLSLSPDSQQRTEEECWRKEEVEECWRKVETLFFRPENSVPVFTESRDSEELLDQYRTKVEDLKARLEESEHLRLKLEDQLRAATDLDQSSDIQAEALRGTRESSQQVKTPPVTPTILLLDSEGNLRDLLHTGTTPSSSSPSSPVSHIEGKTTETNSDLQNHQGCERVHGSDIMDNIESPSLITDQSADTDDSPQSICVEQHLPPDHEVQRRLTQDMQLLLCQEEALNQRNQELLHQLTEANHEIEGLRAEISRRSSETRQLPDEELQHLRGEDPRHLHEEEEKESDAVEDLQAGLILRSQELLEAQSLISSLVESLRETEELLEVSDAAEKGEELKEDAEEEEELHPQCFEESEVKLDTQLDQSEQNLEGHHMQNTEIEEAEKGNHQLAEEAEPDVRGRSHMDEDSSRVLVSAEEKICAVIEDMMKRMKAVDKLWELMQEVEVSLSDEEEEPMMKSQLKMEEVLWRSMLNKLETNDSKDLEEKPEKELLREVTERMMVEKQILCLGLSLIPETAEGKEGLMDTNLICRTNEIHFRDVTKMKMSLLNLIASSISSSISSNIQERLHLLASRLSDSQLSEDSWFRLSLFAAAESLSCSRLNHLQSKCERKPEIEKQTLPTSSSSSSSLCLNCVDLLKENQELREKLTNRAEEQSSSSSMREQTDSSCQTEETQTQDAETEMEYKMISEENVEQTEEEDEDEEKMEEDSMKGEESTEADIEEMLLLRGLVKELEEQLFVMREVFDGKLSSVQRQHEREMEKLKATCGRGLGSMEESHSKVVEELQRRHHQEVERLLLERDRLLEEESAATATAIEAIKNAHRVELQEEKRRHQCECECSSGNTPLEEIYRRHREELASSQRELQVLSQQFSLRCLEVGHLVQALEAERKALSVCQQENQHLRTRNQELSAHLAAEITRLCSQVKQDDLPLGQRMDVYEMEITLRVKESEVQSLIQETTSLKDELQTAQKEKRNATKKYKEMFTELNVLRAKTERETDELRENLRLAHRALDQTNT